VPNSNTLATAGLNLSQTGDEGFAALKASVGMLAAAGVDVMLSLGGWECVCKQPLHDRARVQTSAMSCPLLARGPARISNPSYPFYATAYTNSLLQL
jgi:hypothetical protein